MSCVLVSGGMIVVFKQKTAYEMRISDWRSDVCSSELLVNHLAVIAFVEDRRRGEDRVEALDEFLAPAHQVHQPLNVLHHRPAIVERVALGEGVAPFIGVERGRPRAVLVAAADPAALIVDRKSTRLNSSH